MKKIKLIATNGSKEICLGWIGVGADIYGSITHPEVKLHRSYHRDGNIHWKRDSWGFSVKGSSQPFGTTGYTKETIKGSPIKSLKRSFSFLQAGMRLDDECFNRALEHNRKKIDKTILVDSRVIKGSQKKINFYVDLIKEGSYSSLGRAMNKKLEIARRENMAADFYCYLEFNPWILVTTLYRK